MPLKPLFLGLSLGLLLTACGGGSGGGSPAPAAYVPVILTPPAVESMLASNEDAETPAISGDGRCVAFQDKSANAVLGDTNELPDVLFYDEDTAAKAHASRGLGGVPGNGEADLPAIDMDGSHVAFESLGSNLVANDTNNALDVFMFTPDTGATTRVSVDSQGNQAEGGYSGDPAISDDGTIIAFRSTATNLVPGDTNDNSDVFVHDASTGMTSRISITSGGAQATGGGSWNPHISGDGNLVVFESEADDLDAADTNGLVDVFLHNRALATTIRISVDTTGGDPDGSSYGPRISADGRIVVFSSDATDLVAGDTNGERDIFTYEVISGTIRRVSVGPAAAEAIGGQSWEPDISGDGRYVVYTSFATNLVGGDTNDVRDVFRYDRLSGTTIRVNVSETNAQVGGGGEDPAISHDGTRVAFLQRAGYLNPDDLRAVGNDNVFMKDLTNRAVTLISTAADRMVLDSSTGPSGLSPNGLWYAFSSSATNLVPGDTDNRRDLFMRNMITGDITRILEGPAAVENDSFFQGISVSNDGYFVCFESSEPAFLPSGVDTNGTRDVLVLDTRSGVVERVSVHTDGTEGDKWSGSAVMSADGRYVLFRTDAKTLVTGDTSNNSELLIHDRSTGQTSRAVADKDGMPIEEDVDGGDMSDDGRYVSFSTTATDVTLTPDMHGGEDLFRHDRQTGTNVLATVDSTGSQITDGTIGDPRMSGNGMVLMWNSFSSTIVPDDTNGITDLFVRDLGLGTTTRVNVDSAGNETLAGFPRPVSLSTDGDVVIFRANSPSLVPGLVDLFIHVFAHQRSTGTTIVAGRAPNGGLPQTRGDVERNCLGPNGRIFVYEQNYRRVPHGFMVDLARIRD